MKNGSSPGPPPVPLVPGHLGAPNYDTCRSMFTNLRAAGVDPADLADMAGHSISVADARYVHALGRSFDDVRKVVG